jgi:hypothetical protein
MVVTILLVTRNTDRAWRDNIFLLGFIPWQQILALVLMQLAKGFFLVNTLLAIAIGARIDMVTTIVLAGERRKPARLANIIFFL